MMAMRRRVRVLLAAGVALVLAGGTFYVLRDDGPSYPDAWDARVQPFTTIVEKQRGMKFDHPVTVRFLDAKAFEKTVRADKSELDKDDKKEIEQTASLFRAFGLLSGGIDLFDAFNDATGSGTLAYYSFEDEAITVRGKKLTRATHATLVHELTHALQDQRFDIGDRVEKLTKESADGEPSTQVDALNAIIEGDAERVSDLYRGTLSDKERKALEQAEATDTDTALKSLENVPKSIQTLLGAPYALGQALAETIAADDDDALDKLFDDPPPDDSVLLDPLKAIGNIRDSTDVKIPTLAKGEKKVETGQMGALVTYLMLAERIDLKQALVAADAWNGDAFISFRRDGVVCARVDYAAKGSTGSALGVALDEWATAVGQSAKVTRHADRVTFESCDPGKNATLAKDASSDALELVATRSYLASALIGSGATTDVARCFSRKLVDEFSVKELTDPKFGAGDSAVADRISALAGQCR